MVTVKELQAELRKRGLQTTGLKAELVQRLAEASANETKKEGTADGTPRKKSKTQSKRKSSTANSKGASKRRKKELAGYGTIPPHITPDELCHPNTTRNFADLLVRMKVRRIPRDVLTWAIKQRRIATVLRAIGLYVTQHLCVEGGQVCSPHEGYYEVEGGHVVLKAFCADAPMSVEATLFEDAVSKYGTQLKGMQIDNEFPTMDHVALRGRDEYFFCLGPWMEEYKQGETEPGIVIVKCWKRVDMLQQDPGFNFDAAEWPFESLGATITDRDIAAEFQAILDITQGKSGHLLLNGWDDTPSAMRANESSGATELHIAAWCMTGPHVDTVLADKKSSTKQIDAAFPWASE